MIFLVVVLHSGLVYELVLQKTWIVVDQNIVDSIGLLRMYLDLFVMFIMFFISGYFVPLSLQRNSSRRFILTKFRRIMIPWLIAVLTLIPAYKAIFLYSRGLPQEAWYSYFHFYSRDGADLLFFADNPTQNWLWFLPVLFLFQIIYMAMHKSNLLSRKLSLKAGAILTFVIGLIYSMLISEIDMVGWYHSSIFHFQRERLLIYFVSFLLGSLSCKLRVFDSDNRHIKYYILSNLVLTIALGIFTLVALNMFFNIVNPSRNYFFISDFGDRLTYYAMAILSMLSFLYVLIHVFRFNFNRISPLIGALNRGSYSVYIIHVIILGLLALIMMDLSLPGIVKFILLASSTFVLSNVIVYIYGSWFIHNPSVKIATFCVLVVALFAFIQFGNKLYSTQEIQKSNRLMSPQIDLHEAVINGGLEVVKYYIDLGVNLDAADATGGSSPLITAAFFGRTDIAMFLIEAGANLNFQNHEGSTALHTAAFFGRIEIVESLLKNGADKSITNNAGSTPLQSVSATFETAKPIYQYFEKAYAPLGLIIDYEKLKTSRLMIAKILELDEY